MTFDFFKKHKALFVAAIVIFTFIAIKIGFSISKSSSYTPIKPLALHTNGQGFAGSQECMACHVDIYQSHIKTSHFTSSTLANDESILFQLIKKSDGFYQNTYSTEKVLIDCQKHGRRENLECAHKPYQNVEKEGMVALLSHTRKRDNLTGRYVGTARTRT